MDHKGANESVQNYLKLSSDHLKKWKDITEDEPGMEDMDRLFAMLLKANATLSRACEKFTHELTEAHKTIEELRLRCGMDLDEWNELYGEDDEG